MNKSAQHERYIGYLKSDAWSAKRAAVIFRDQGRCQAMKNGARCGSRYKLEVHHCTYVRFGRELLKDLLCLCMDCHEKEHERKKKRLVATLKQRDIRR